MKLKFGAIKANNYNVISGDSTVKWFILIKASRTGSRTWLDLIWEKLTNLLQWNQGTNKNLNKRRFHVNRKKQVVTKRRKISFSKLK